MRFSAKAILQPTSLLLITAGLLVPDAAAGQVTISFAGTVTGAGTGITLPAGVQVGNTISGFFTYTVPQTGNNGTYDFKGTGQSLLFSIPILNNTATFSDQNSNVAPKNLYTVKITDTGTKGATFDIFASMINTAGKSTGPTCDILFTSSTYTGLALPATQAAFTSAFASSIGKFNWDPDGEGVAADITIINGQAVPEPSSLVLAVIALATCTAGSVIISRRKSAKMSKSIRVAQPSHS